MVCVCRRECETCVLHPGWSMAVGWWSARRIAVMKSRPGPPPPGGTACGKTNLTQPARNVVTRLHVHHDETNMRRRVSC